MIKGLGLIGKIFLEFFVDMNFGCFSVVLFYFFLFEGIGFIKRY